MFELLSDPGLYQFLPTDPPPTLDALVTRYERLATRSSPASDELWLNWIARAKSDGMCVGRVEVTIRGDASAYFAYEIGAGFQRRGFATEACRRVIQALFADYGLTRIVAEVDTRNVASIALLERLGFQRGSMRPHADFFKGAPSDEYTYILTR
jgi:RimJ/RimL family protein N-acetyltransferase